MFYQHNHIYSVLFLMLIQTPAVALCSTVHSTVVWSKNYLVTPGCSIKTNKHTKFSLSFLDMTFTFTIYTCDCNTWKQNFFGLCLKWKLAHTTFLYFFIVCLIQGRKKVTLVKTWGYAGLSQSFSTVKAVIPLSFFWQISGPPESPCKKSNRNT